ncbi:DUF3145 domain-containing protein [Acidipropionibacterium acidipropionici]|uniref:DUF3145 domain-containing protein n=1 Tax=Acidipropionibacterium acidipropionici TaxID=1748 RepID=UPI00110A685B|nr:DUF3145 domain-containing protein [Acidipropionibacterium acidipropionici]QCV95179.1 DUF3145 domain-containing protein [Acidipropionibacterium acidipropionici]
MKQYAHQVSGMLYIHSAPTALRAHIEWAADAAVTLPMGLGWQRQPVDGSWRVETHWQGDAEAAAGLVSTLATWGRLRLEVTVDPSPCGTGHRWSVTPELGIFSADTNEIGDVVVDENRLRQAMVRARSQGEPLETEIADLLGEPWDVELEPFRACDPDLDVSWLGSQVG